MNFVDLPTRSDIAFEPLTDAKYSAQTVQILKNLCFGRCSELNALSTYLYQDWSFYPSMHEIANIMEQIAIVEMTHLDVLSNAIVAFGGKPDYTLDGVFWNARSVNLNLILPEAMRQNIVDEECAINAYEKAINKVDNLSLKRIFAKIIADEKTHITIFREILRRLDK